LGSWRRRIRCGDWGGVRHMARVRFKRMKDVHLVKWVGRQAKRAAPAWWSGSKGAVVSHPSLDLAAPLAGGVGGKKLSATTVWGGGEKFKMSGELTFWSTCVSVVELQRTEGIRNLEGR